MEITPSNKRYNSLNGLRAFASIGIVILHVWQKYEARLDGFILNTLIASFDNLVYLFMVISGFSLCCGYYEKVKNGTISWGAFYKKRFAKVWPLFAFLSMLELVLSPKLETIYDVFMNCTLMFGLVPLYDTSVIGVGWFLGVVFVFYLVFPFFCTLLEKKWKAWGAFGVSLVITALLRFHYLSTSYPGIEYISRRRNFIFCAPFFLAGGLIYLYRDTITKFVKKFWYIMVLICVATLTAYFYSVVTTTYTFTLLLVLIISAVLVCYAIGMEKKGLLNNPVTVYFGNISMEIYLCHMLAYRLLDIIGATSLIQNPLVSFIILFILTFALALGLALAFRFGMTCAKNMVDKLFIKRKTDEQ